MAKNTRLICAHAYQSYVWNRAATRRVEQYGLQCVEGDLVPVDDSGAAVAVEEVASLDANAAEQAAVTGGGGASGGNNFQSANQAKQGTIRVVTADDVAANRFTIHDVILPLPGTNSVFPTNDIGEFYSCNFLCVTHILST